MMPAPPERICEGKTAPRQAAAAADRAGLAVMQFHPAGSMGIAAAFVRHLVARRISAIPEIAELSVYPLEGRQAVWFAAELRKAH